MTNSLAGGAGWDDVKLLLLETSQSPKMHTRLLSEV